MDTKRNSKDSVFKDLFEDVKYKVQVFEEIHPDIKIKEEDIADVTLENVITNQQINDLGFTVKDKLVFLLEAQSTWSENIVSRALLYYAETLRRWIIDNEKNIYGNKTIKILKPELFVVYTGKDEVLPLLESNKVYFNGEACDIEIRVHVIHDTNNISKITAQYILFCQIFNEQREKYGYSKKTIEETIRICKDRGILVPYLETRESEVIGIMESIFSQEMAMKLYTKEIKEESHAEGHEEGQEAERLVGIRKMAEMSLELDVNKNACFSKICEKYPEVDISVIEDIVNVIYEEK